MKRVENGTYAVNYHQQPSSIMNNLGVVDDIRAIETPSATSTTFCSLTSPLSTPDLAFLERIPDFVHVLSLRGLFLHVIQESCKNVLEYDAKDLIGHKISQFVHPSDLVTVMRDLRNCSSDGSVNYICRMKRKFSGYVYMEMNGHVYTGSK